VFELESVTGYGANPAEEQEFRPFYLVKDTDTTAGHTTNRTPRMLTAQERQFDKNRTGTIPRCRWWTPTARRTAPTCASSASRRCTNRRLPSDAVGAAHGFSMGLNAPVTAIRCVTGPTGRNLRHRRPLFLAAHQPSVAQLSHAGGFGEGDDGAAVRELPVVLLRRRKKRLFLRQIEGLPPSSPGPVRRVAAPGQFLRAAEITGLDEAAFEGTGFVLGAVLR
jgi:type VI protein secretion system component VasA